MEYEIDSEKIKRKINGKKIEYFNKSISFDKITAKVNSYINIVINDDQDYVFYSYYKNNDDKDYLLSTEIKLSEVNKKNLYQFPKIIIDSDLKHEYKKKIKSITKKYI